MLDVRVDGYNVKIVQIAYSGTYNIITLRRGSSIYNTPLISLQIVSKILIISNITPFYGMISTMQLRFHSISTSTVAPLLVKNAPTYHLIPLK